MRIGLHVKCPLLLSNFNETSLFFANFRNVLISNFMKIRWVGAEMFLADRRDEASSRFSQFCGQKCTYIARAMDRTPIPSVVLPIEQSFNLTATEQFWLLLLALAGSRESGAVPQRSRFWQGQLLLWQTNMWLVIGGSGASMKWKEMGVTWSVSHSESQVVSFQK